MAKELDASIIHPLKFKIFYETNIDSVKKIKKEVSGLESISKKTTKSVNDLGIVTRKTNSSFEKMSKDSKKHHKEIFDIAKEKTNQLKSGLDRLSMTYIGLGLSIVGMVREAHSQNQKILGWHNMFKDMSNATGDASEAVKIYTGVWSKSKASLSTIESSMRSLNAAGIITGKTMEDMTLFISDLHQASGLSVDTLGNFTGELMSMWQVSKSASKEMVNSIVALGDVFNFTTSQMELVMKTSQTAITKMGMFFKNTSESSKQMIKGISASIGVMRKFGVSIQEANNFMDKLFNPENFAENQALLARLGFSFQEQMDMMENAGNKEMFFDKLMTRLPELSKQITSLRNPMARLQFAKNLGLPLEIAQKMAKATGNEIKDLMEDYKKQAKEQEAIAKKEAKAKQDAARFGEALDFIKMKALFPMMQFIQKNYDKFFKIAGAAANLFSKYAKIMVDVMDKFVPVIDKLVSGDLKGAMEGVIGGIMQAIPVVAKAAIDIFIGIIPQIPKMFIRIFTGLWKSGPIGKFLAPIATTFAFIKAKNFLSDILGGIKGKLGSKANPMHVTMSDDTVSKFGFLKNIFGKIKDIKNVGVAREVLKTAGARIASKAGAAVGILKGVGSLAGGIVSGIGAPALAVGALVTGIGVTTFKAYQLAKKHNQGILNDQEKRQREELMLKQAQGKKLTIEEEKRLTEINKKYTDNHKSIIGGFGLLGKWITDIWNNIWNRLKTWGRQISTWLSDYIMQPWRYAMTYLSLEISKMIAGTPFGKGAGELKIAQNILDEYEKARSLGEYGRTEINRLKSKAAAFKMVAEKSGSTNVIDVSNKLIEIIHKQDEIISSRLQDKNAEDLLKKQLKQQEINNKINGGILTATTKMANKEEKTENKNDKWLTMLLYNNMYDPNFKINIG